MRVLAVQLSKAFPHDDTNLSSVEPFLRLIDSESAKAIVKFRRIQDAQRCLIGRMLPRYYFSTAFSVPWDSIHVERTARGRPYVTHPSLPSDVDFNISHDGNWIVLGVSEARDQAQCVGVDVMRVAIPWDDETVDGFVTTLADHLTIDEMKWLHVSADNTEKLSRVFALWTLKEAYTKALGDGLSFELKRLEVFPMDNTHIQGAYSANVDGHRLFGWHFKLTWLADDVLLAVVTQSVAHPDISIEEVEFSSIVGALGSC